MYVCVYIYIYILHVCFNAAAGAAEAAGRPPRAPVVPRQYRDSVIIVL